MARRKPPGTAAWLLVCCALLTGGCAAVVNEESHGDIQPVSPADTEFAAIPTIDRVKPVLKWSDTSQETRPIAYELALWSGVVIAISPEEQTMRRGDLILQVGDLPCCEFGLPRPLTPGQCYFWSVRRNGDSRWATVVHEKRPSTLFTILRDLRSHKMELPFRFRVASNAVD